MYKVIETRFDENNNTYTTSSECQTLKLIRLHVQDRVDDIDIESVEIKKGNKSLIKADPYEVVQFIKRKNSNDNIYIIEIHQQRRTSR